MIVPSAPNFVSGELNTPGGVNRLNGFLRSVEQTLRNLDFANNFKGTLNSITVQNGKPTRVPVQASFINVLKMTPNKDWSDVNVTTAPVQGGYNITVSWSGLATSAVVELFTGVA